MNPLFFKPTILLAEIATPLILAALYGAQIAFPWISEYTGIDHPLWGFAAALMLSVGILCAPHAPKFWRWAPLRPRVPDYLFLGFVLICLFRQVWDGRSGADNYVHLFDSVLFYAVGRFVGHNASRPFIFALMLIAFVSLALCVPVIYSLADSTVMMERFIFPFGLVAAQWPGIIVGALTVASFATALTARRKLISRAAFWVAALAPWFLIYIGARSVLVAVLAVMLLLVFVLKSKPFWTKAKIFAVVLFIASVGILFVPSTRFEFLRQLPLSLFGIRLEDLPRPRIIHNYDEPYAWGTCVIKGDSIKMRMVLYRDAMISFAQNPLAGVGVGRFGEQTCLYGFGQRTGDPHSTILHVASEIGILGLIPFLAFLGWVGAQSFMILRMKQEGARAIMPVLASLISIWLFHLINDQFSTGYLSAMQFYLISGVLVGCLVGLKDSRVSFCCDSPMALPPKGQGPKVSIVTVCYNSAPTISDTLDSVAAQNYPNIEHIIVDGASKDKTLEIVRERGAHVAQVISEPDKGIYDAMNKGVRAATGDVVGFINADDFLACPNAIATIAAAFNDETVEAVFGDLCYVSQNDKNNIVRYWQSAPFKPGSFERGWAPPHPTFYVRRTVYDKLGLYDISFPLASDNELMMRFLEKHKVRAQYLHKVLVKMRLGGATNKSVRNVMNQNKEIWRALKLNGLRASVWRFFGGKILSRGMQFLRRPYQPRKRSI